MVNSNVAKVASSVLKGAIALVGALMAAENGFGGGTGLSDDVQFLTGNAEPIRFVQQGRFFWSKPKLMEMDRYTHEVREVGKKRKKAK